MMFIMLGSSIRGMAEGSTDTAITTSAPIFFAESTGRARQRTPRRLSVFRCPLPEGDSRVSKSFFGPLSLCCPPDQKGSSRVQVSRHCTKGDLVSWMFPTVKQLLESRCQENSGFIIPDRDPMELMYILWAMVLANFWSRCGSWPGSGAMYFRPKDS